MGQVAISAVATRHGLSEKHLAFVQAVNQGLPPTRAAEVAGFHPLSCTQLLRNPSIAAALHEAVQMDLQADAAVNLKVLRSIRDDKEAPKGVRADIAIKLMRLAGHVEPTKHDKEAEKQLSEMSGEELRSYIERNQVEIDRIEGELAARAMDVSAPASAPKDKAPDAKSLDYLG